MARASSYFAQAVSAPAVRAALSKVARSHSVVEFVHLLTAHHGDAVDCELHSRLAAFQQPTAHPTADPSADGDADLDGAFPPNLRVSSTEGIPE
jgi:hypothetical protein